MQDEPGDGKKSLIPQYVLFGGLLLAGGISALTLALLYTKKNEDVKTLEQQLSSKEIIYIRETDSLSSELKQVNDKYIILAADNKALGDNLLKEQTKSSRLAAANTAYFNREKQYKIENATLKQASARAASEKEKAVAEADILRSQIRHLQGLLDERDKDLARLKSQISQQSNIIGENFGALSALRDSIKSEQVSGYFNNTEVAGAWGLSEIDVPYTRYFSGISTINGYVINKNFLTGLGIGLYYYNSGWMAPVYLDFRYSFAKRKYTPYVWADGGFLIDLKTWDLPSGMFMNPGVGLYYDLSDRLKLNAGIGAYVQKHYARSSFINLKIGITFRGGRK